MIVFVTAFGNVAAVEPPGSVVVIYNSRMAESKAVAEHYVKVRQVPTDQVLALELATGETMSRGAYRSDLQRPLLRWLEDKRLLTFRSVRDPAATGPLAGTHWKVTEARVRYVVLCYGIPLRIAPDLGLREEGMDAVPEPIRRNGAAVESELALLPFHDYKLPLTGPLRNPLYGATNGSALHPTNGILMVARLDGPTAAIAQSLVDKAIEAEKNGLWGRAYFDLRGLTNGLYKPGDDSLRMAAEVSRGFGFETSVDNNAATFGAGYPMSQIAFYAGWYDADVSGPFTRNVVEFMPGAFAYHLHSFSASSLRGATNHWVGPLLAKGAAATMGAIDEPYLEGTPDLGAFALRFLPLGMSFGEAAYASLPVLSWQITIVGDPLYRPFDRPPLQRHQELEAQKNKLIEWSHVKAMNINLINGLPIADLISHLENEPLTPKSAVLSEKLAQLYEQQGKPASAIHAYRQALKADPTPQQQIRLLLILSDKLAVSDANEAAKTLRELLSRFADYPDRAVIEAKIAELSKASRS